MPTDVELDMGERADALLIHAIKLDALRSGFLVNTNFTADGRWRVQIMERGTGAIFGHAEHKSEATAWVKARRRAFEEAVDAD